MKNFSYVCGDRGIPVPGQKGASIHVASVCREFIDAGLTGTVFSSRPQEQSLHGLPIVELATESLNESTSPAERLQSLVEDEALGSDDIPCDFVYERYSLWHLEGLARARRLGVPFVLEVNSPLPEEAKRYRSLPNEDLAQKIARLLMREADAIVCVSRAVADWVSELRGHSNQVWIVPNGVDPNLFGPKPDEARPAELPPVGTPVIAFCGSFRPWHAVNDLFDAFAKLEPADTPDPHLLCVGDGPLLEGFAERVRSAGLSNRVHLTGALPHAEVAGYLRHADVAVAPYPTLDHFYFSPLKIYEFMALGLPVVAADIGQIPEILDGGRRGLMYPAGDTQALSATLTRVLRTPGEARSLAEAGRKWVLAHATWSERVREILEGIRNL